MSRTANIRVEPGSGIQQGEAISYRVEYFEFVIQKALNLVAHLLMIVCRYDSSAVHGFLSLFQPGHRLPRLGFERRKVRPYVIILRALLLTVTLVKVTGN
jgi:hypothetical protein